MRVKVRKTSLLPVTAGQEVDILEREVATLVRLGVVERAKKAKPKKAKPRKKTEKAETPAE